MAKKDKLKQKKLKFFATYFYGFFYWCLLLIAICTFVSSLIILDTDNFSFAFGSSIVLFILAILFRILKSVREKSSYKKLTIIPDGISYSSEEIKHYMGLKENDPLESSYNEMVQKFKKMSKAKLIWAITSSQDNTEYRSAADTDITTIPAEFKMATCPVMLSKMKVPMLLDIDGNPFYLFPHFVIKIAGKKAVYAISYADLALNGYSTKYILGYGESVPKDSEMLSKAYMYSNNDGSPDKRYTDNPWSPIISVGELDATDHNISYMVSNTEATLDFSDALDIHVLKTQTYAEMHTAADLSVFDDSNDKMPSAELATDVEEKKEVDDDKAKKNHKSPKQSTNPYEELQSLIGLGNVKAEIQTLANLVQVQQARAKEGLKNSSMSYHLVFTGNPGTGKTTIARIIASIYKDLGILQKGHLVETDRSGLVAEYLGQTAVKTNKIIDEALDGVLFIDEAYTLTDEKDSYGKEAVATLLKRMEDDRDRLVVILAGYTDNMKQFISTNPGLESRFNRYIDFPDYSEEELLQIFMSMVKKYDYVLSDETILKIKEAIHQNVENKDKQFGNARFIRNMFEKILANQANRLAKDSKLDAQNLRCITIDDCLL